MAYIREGDLFEIPEALVKREVIGQSLAGMLDFAQGIYHRNAGEFRHAFDGFMRERAQHDSAYPALEIVRNVAEGFPRIETFMPLIDERNRATESTDARFKR